MFSLGVMLALKAPIQIQGCGSVAKDHVCLQQSCSIAGKCMMVNNVHVRASACIALKAAVIEQQTRVAMGSALSVCPGSWQQADVPEVRISLQHP